MAKQPEDPEREQLIKAVMAQHAQLDYGMAKLCVDTYMDAPELIDRIMDGEFDDKIEAPQREMSYEGITVE